MALIQTAGSRIPVEDGMTLYGNMASHLSGNITKSS